jgi:hypothetical protein
MTTKRRRIDWERIRSDLECARETLQKRTREGLLEDVREAVSSDLNKDVASSYVSRIMYKVSPRLKRPLLTAIIPDLKKEYFCQYEREAKFLFNEISRRNGEEVQEDIIIFNEDYWVQPENLEEFQRIAFEYENKRGKVMFDTAEKITQAANEIGLRKLNRFYSEKDSELLVGFGFNHGNYILKTERRKNENGWI